MKQKKKKKFEKKIQNGRLKKTEFFNSANLINKRHGSGISNSVHNGQTIHP